MESSILVQCAQSDIGSPTFTKCILTLDLIENKVAPLQVYDTSGKCPAGVRQEETGGYQKFHFNQNIYLK